ncbi:growth/differentiation factor 6-like isoform X2 [Cottoperca gobio]|uniref:Growth/differentiation factor 6-like isoform X2 n=1 Tax=Cottoperca gobio TaxID=56716 RepID=A0A6J2QUB8_COTGO|nr:growth/differentiation factor 6-like isoform X2 [Cottoperca gobio]
MSFAFTVMTMLLGSSMVTAFVLQPSKEEPAAAANSPASHHRCQGGSLQSMRKGLLEALNLQAEPRLPAGALDGVREQWRTTFGSIIHQDTADAGNSTSLKCCSMASEIFMKDLGWDNWVIHPASLTIVQCALCNPEGNTVQCPSPHTNVDEVDTQVPCCQPTSQQMVPVLYLGEFNTLIIASVQLARSCGCGPSHLQQPGTE